ncbi:hypothetical protein RCG67_12980 [Kocuria sp. CPCC 205292]|uniref:hypothetical protein n=1 Tax=Kocuria cellulosilytica TaxID=3071451 RepID=UPI0034D5BDFC
MIRYPRRPSPLGAAAAALSALCLLALAGCGTGQQQPGLVLETRAGSPSAVPSGPSPEPRTCFDVASAYTALTLVPLSGDEPDPHFRPQDAAASVRELVPGLPAELRPAFDDAVAALGAAGPSVQPAELAELQRTLAPVGDWLREACAEPTPSK